MMCCSRFTVLYGPTPGRNTPGACQHFRWTIQSYLLPPGQGPACSISLGAPCCVLRSWRRSPVSKCQSICQCLWRDIAHPGLQCFWCSAACEAKTRGHVGISVLCPCPQQKQHKGGKSGCHRWQSYGTLLTPGMQKVQASLEKG